MNPLDSAWPAPFGQSHEPAGTTESAQLHGETSELPSFIVKLGGLLEMCGLARPSLQRKENRQTVTRRSGQTAMS